MITLADYWMGRDQEPEYGWELTDQTRANAMLTVEKANALLAAFQSATGDHDKRSVTSGWRPRAVNSSTPNAAQRSKHIEGLAIDLSDPEGDLDEWCLANPLALQVLGLWQEHPSATKGWCHVQTVPPKSGNRVFYP